MSSSSFSNPIRASPHFPRRTASSAPKPITASTDAGEGSEGVAIEDGDESEQAGNLHDGGLHGGGPLGAAWAHCLRTARGIIPG